MEQRVLDGSQPRFRDQICAEDASSTEQIMDLRQAFGVLPSGEAVTRARPGHRPSGAVTRVLPVAAKSDDSELAAPPIRKPVRRKPRKKDSKESPLGELFDRVRCDVVAWTESLGHQDQLLRFLRVVRELLLDRSCEKVIRGNWSAILAPLTQEVSERDFMNKVVREVVDSSTSARLTSGGEILSVLLQAIDSAAEIHSILEDHVIPDNPELAIETLDRLIKPRPKWLLPLLVRLLQHTSPMIHDHTKEALISLARNPAIVEEWAREYPGDLVDPAVFSRIVEREDPEHLMDAFKKFFTHAPPECSLRLLRLITPDLPGVDYILITAIQYGPAEAHDFALDFLDRSCIPVVTGALIQTVRLNNYQTNPSMKELEAALDALCKLDEPKAREFLEEVETSRSGWLRYEYRREVRDTLKKIRNQQGKN